MTQSQCVVVSYRALGGLLRGEAEGALEAAQRALEFWEKRAREEYPVAQDRVRVEWLLGWALVALAEEEGEARREEAEGYLVEAEGHLTEALTRCRRINNVELEPDILLAWARWHRLKGNREEARRQAEDALYIADRCEYRLKQAEVHNFLAQMALEEGDKEGARREAEMAKERALCDGEPHWYKPALEEAERLLEEMQ